MVVGGMGEAEQGTAESIGVRTPQSVQDFQNFLAMLRKENGAGLTPPDGGTKVGLIWGQLISSSYQLSACYLLVNRWLWTSTEQTL